MSQVELDLADRDIYYAMRALMLLVENAGGEVTVLDYPLERTLIVAWDKGKITVSLEGASPKQ